MAPLWTVEIFAKEKMLAGTPTTRDTLLFTEDDRPSPGPLQDTDADDIETAALPQKQSNQQQQQKKRQSLRDRFQILQQVVPALQRSTSGNGKSEAVILQKSTIVVFIYQPNALF